MIAPVPTVELPAVVELDPAALMLHASGPVAFVLWALIVAAAAVWVIAVLKSRVLRRWQQADGAFAAAVQNATTLEDLLDVCRVHPDALGVDIVTAQVCARAEPDTLEAATQEALAKVEERTHALLPILASIGSAAPFVGLLGTVYGILDAFLRIGREKSAALPVVAPAIGEALIATAMGLFAAIPAVVLYNALARREDVLRARLAATAQRWARRIAKMPDPQES